MSYRICIVEDEKKASDILSTLLRKHMTDLQGIHVFNNPADAVEGLKTIDPHLVFLDINMPGMDGFELLDAVNTRNFQVVFVTAYDQFAIQAIKVSALDYLLKPLAESELVETLDRFKNNLNNNNTGKIEALMASLKKQETAQLRIGISGSERTYFFDAIDVVRCEAYSNYTHFYFVNRTKMLSSRTLKNHEETLVGRGFLRIHKSHLINPNCIKSVIGRSRIEMLDGSVVPIARRRRSEVLKSISTIGI